MHQPPVPNQPQVSKIAIALHGGAGTILKSQISADQEVAYTEALDTALRIGWDLLAAGATALEAVTATVVWLENCPLFNAGRGAVFTHTGGHELDAALMEGHTNKAGAVAGGRTIKNPILAAKAVMEHTDHVLLAHAGAEELAAEQGLELVSPDYFSTDFRKAQLDAALVEGRVLLDHDGKIDGEIKAKQDAVTSGDPIDPNHKFGTVGAVALDQYGHLAAATSTGGMTNKRYNRIGDSPLIGAGTWADENVAISATGHGEVFISNVVAYDVAARIKYQGKSLEQACQATIIEHLGSVAPDSGGIVAVDRFGNVCLPFNTEGMYRAWQTESVRGVEIYKD